MSEERKEPKRIRWSEGFRRPEKEEREARPPREEKKHRGQTGRPYDKQLGNPPYQGRNEERREGKTPGKFPRYKEGRRTDAPDFVIRRDRPTTWNREPEPSREAEVRSWVRRIASLKTDKGREKEQRFLADGVRCIDEILKYSSGALVKVLTGPGFNRPDILSKVKALGVETEEVTQDELDFVATTVTHQGIVAVCNQAALRPKWETARLVTLVDSVQDPGNLGSIFRSSLAFGMDAVILGQGTVDPFNPKVVRGSSGTFLRVPFETGCDLAERYEFLRSKGFTVVATSPHARNELSTVKMRRKVAFLIGNEGAGADTRLIDAADETVRIPMYDDVESLNVAVAHGILASQLWKLRSR